MPGTQRIDVANSAREERGGHWIKRNFGSSVPERLIFFDTETNEEHVENSPGNTLLTLRLGCARLLERKEGKWIRSAKLEFTTVAQFWEWLGLYLSKYQSTWIFAHNLVFDLTVCQFWQHLESGEWHIWEEDDLHSLKELAKSGRKPFHGFFCDKDPPTIIQCRHRSGKTAIFLDTMNYWPVKLATLGEKIGCKKRRQPTLDESDGNWMKYCWQDVNVIEKAVTTLIDWWDRNDLGRFRYTTGALALGCWRHKYMQKWVHRHEVQEVRDLERRAYYSGRLELNYYGDYNGPVYELDVNGLYPFVLRECLYPVELWDWWDGGKKQNLIDRGPVDYAVADCLVKIDQPAYPFRTCHGTIWPKGKFWTTLCGPEYRKAVEQGHILKVKRWAIFRTGRPFREFVNQFWAERLNAAIGSHCMPELFIKQLLNSLHGKMGQKTPVWKDIYHGDDLPELRHWRVVNAQTGERRVYRRVGRRVQQQVDAEDHKLAVPMISAWTTAWSRDFMDNARVIAGEENVLYQVSDALHVTTWGKARLEKANMIHPTELGKFKIKKTGDSARYDAIHQYRLGDESVNGALPVSCVPREDGNFDETRFADLNTILAGPPPSGVMVYTTMRRPPKNWQRGHIQSDGRVEALTVKFDKLADYNSVLNGKLPRLWEGDA